LQHHGRRRLNRSSVAASVAASLDFAPGLNLHQRNTKGGEAMTQKSKLRSSFAEAVADIPDGATIAFSGFAMPGTPFNLIRALREQGAKRLTLVGNTTGGAQQPRMPDIGMLVENGQVAKVICAFTAATRPTDVLPFTKFYESGEVDAELVPQGTLAERMRAAGAGIPAFYTPTAVGTELAEGRETRVINGREYLLEYALKLDYAFIRARTADAAGNLRFHRSQRNFGPVMATAARVTIAEIDNPIVATGSIDPDDVHTSGIYVHRLVQVPPEPEGLWPTKRQARGQENRR
jgi:3-oxoacid CoA-transferase A subunit